MRKTNGFSTVSTRNAEGEKMPTYSVMLEFSLGYTEHIKINEVKKKNNGF